jgi:UDP-3-O-[3-hydroxymyristoyl] N-acetylglucosamine deacetylase
VKNLVLIVDDEPGILASMSGVLNDEGYSTHCVQSGEEALEYYGQRRPDVVFLDVWLPDRDGLETLQAIRELDPTASVILMSGHGSASTAVKAIKMGAYDYVEKPLSYVQVVDATAGAVAFGQSVTQDFSLRDRTVDRIETGREFLPPPTFALVQESEVAQRTVASSKVLYGLGLHSGSRTGMAIQPLPPDSGIHFLTLPDTHSVLAHVSAVADTGYATTLSAGGNSIRTVEHLLSALHAYGITNLLIKVHGEIPVLDGSAVEFCDALESAGIQEQDAPRREIVIDRPYEVSDGDRVLRIEPAPTFSVSYLLRYPPPVGEQLHEFEMTSPETYCSRIAPARTFGFMRDLKMMSELGLGSGGRLDNFVLVGEDNVLNTELRFPDEFARHKILDIIGDLYLLGFPIRGRVTARLTGHRFNIALLREILTSHEA